MQSYIWLSINRVEAAIQPAGDIVSNLPVKHRPHQMSPRIQTVPLVFIKVMNLTSFHTIRKES